MEHVSRSGETKVRRECTLPLTGRRVVDRLITDLAVFDFPPAGGMVLVELEEASRSTRSGATEASFTTLARVDTSSHLGPERRRSRCVRRAHARPPADHSNARLTMHRFAVVLTDRADDLTAATIPPPRFPAPGGRARARTGRCARSTARSPRSSSSAACWSSCGCARTATPTSTTRRAVKSMLRSWHNFFFVSSDPGGLITVDKPPLGLWVQAVSAKMFGFAPLSLLIPEAICAMIAVALLYGSSRRASGRSPALVSALALAVFPSFVAVSRDNGVDPLLILLMLAACGAGWPRSSAAAAA